jgi:transcriptional regulator with XRE-family HTH domain
MTLTEQFHAALTRLRGKQTLREIATHLGVSTPTYYRHERGNTSPSLATVERICGQLGYDVRLIVTRKK